MDSCSLSHNACYCSAPVATEQQLITHILWVTLVIVVANFLTVVCLIRDRKKKVYPMSVYIKGSGGDENEDENEDDKEEDEDDNKSDEEENEFAATMSNDDDDDEDAEDKKDDEDDDDDDAAKDDAETLAPPPLITSSSGSDDEVEAAEDNGTKDANGIQLVSLVVPKEWNGWTITNRAPVAAVKDDIVIKE